MAKTLRIAIALGALAIAGCSKKESTPAKSEGTASKSGLAWEPINYAAMTATCRKALACCEVIAKAAGAASDSDYNVKCSGAALWTDDECAMDLKSRVGMFEAEGKPVPDECK